MPTDLEQSILRTLCWFSVFDRPITGFEIWKWLLEPARAYDVSEVYRVMESSEWLKSRMIEEGGFYYLRSLPLAQNSPPCQSGELEGGGREGVCNRSRHYLDAVRKFRKLRRVCLYMQLFTSVRAVAAVNSIAWFQTTESSDIDLFIITKPGSIWSTRFWIVLPFILLGIRPRMQTQPHDQFCFSFFVSQDAFSFDHLRLKEGDHYFPFWTKSIVPLFDRDQNFDALMKSNAWTQTILPNATIRPLHHAHRSFSLPIRLLHFGWFESFYRSVQQDRFPSIIKELANRDSRVIVTDDMLKFHENDRRAEFEEMYKQRMMKYE